MRKSDIHTMRSDCQLVIRPSDYNRGMRQFEIYGAQLRGVYCINKETTISKLDAVFLGDPGEITWSTDAVILSCKFGVRSPNSTQCQSHLYD